MRRSLALSLATLLLLPVPGPKGEAHARDTALDAYGRAVIGRFTSVEQHRANPAYAEVEARVVRIWPEREDGLWIYQEQAILSGAADRDAARARPYFQRVSRISTEPDGTLLRETFAIQEPARFVGLGGEGYGGPALRQEDLGEAGCPIRIEAAGHGHFAAMSGACPNSHRGAVSMRSASVLAGDRLVNWDRGFGADGRQLWGPEAGGYVFVRMGE
jgi:hypothetical protein